MYDDANRNTRPPLPRPDEPREYVSNTGSMARDGYEVRCRRPRIPGYFDHETPERARNMENIVREYDGPMMDDMDDMDDDY